MNERGTHSCFNFLRKQKSDSESGIDGKVMNSPESYFSIKAIDMGIICCFCGIKFDDIKTLQNHTLQNHQVCTLSNGIRMLQLIHPNLSSIAQLILLPSSFFLNFHIFKCKSVIDKFIINSFILSFRNYCLRHLFRNPQKIWFFEKI